jgi:protein-disulfide isomerase
VETESRNIRPRGLSTLVDVTLVGAVLLLLVLLVRREFVEDNASIRTASPESAHFLPAVDSLTGASGLSGYKARFVVFNDLECPFCAAFHKVLESAVNRHGNLMVVDFRHFPLANHRFARPAAIASECAREQDRFPQMVSTIFRLQDSLGLTSWNQLAATAGVADTTQFDRCRKRTGSSMRVDDDARLGRRLGVSATPTVFLNGWKMSSLPESAELDQIVADLQLGSSKYKTASPTP